jgi:hypothetical protein
MHRVPQLRLVERVMLDALAQRVGPENAPEVLRRSLIGTPLPPATDAGEITEYLHDHLRRSLRRELGAAADDVLRTAEALLAPLRRDALLVGRPAFRAPYVLVSDVPHCLEGVIDLRRVTTLVDALLEADACPEATLVIDLPHTTLSLLTLALASGELPPSTQILVVGASDAEQAEFRAVTQRPTTFLQVYLPLDLRTPAPVIAA